jgi:hypothetical protein
MAGLLFICNDISFNHFFCSREHRQKGFSVRMSAPCWCRTSFFQLCTQSDMVVYLAIENDDITPAGGVHRLMHRLEKDRLLPSADEPMPILLQGPSRHHHHPIRDA